MRNASRARGKLSDVDKIELFTHADHKYEALLIQMDFEKENRANHAARGTEEDEKSCFVS